MRVDFRIKLIVHNNSNLVINRVTYRPKFKDPIYGECQTCGSAIRVDPEYKRITPDCKVDIGGTERFYFHVYTDEKYDTEYNDNIEHVITIRREDDVYYTRYFVFPLTNKSINVDVKVNGRSTSDVEIDARFNDEDEKEEEDERKNENRN